MMNLSTQFPRRHDWQLDEVLALFELPFKELLFQAQCAQRAYFNPNEVQLSSLLNIKTGKCPEDCAYCPQSVHYDTGLIPDALLDSASVLESARAAKQQGASRFCMGAAWRSPKQADVEAVAKLISEVKALGLETCATLGMLSADQAHYLKASGLDYYNHNLDTSESFYENIINTRSYQDRLETLENVQAANLKVCCGGIIGMGETREDRAALLMTLANLSQHPDSVPINQLVKVAGTPLENAEAVDEFEFVRCIAVARILMPASFVRLSAGRTEMNDALQALCFLAGANSIFYGEKLLTTANPAVDHDHLLLNRLGLQTI